jgi:hypothetical protein
LHVVRKYNKIEIMEIEFLEFLEWYLQRMDMPIEGNEHIFIKEYLDEKDAYGEFHKITRELGL